MRYYCPFHCRRYRSCVSGECINIGICELINILKRTPDIILLDVRSPQEYEEGHLREAINISVYDLERYLDKGILPDRNREIVVYCQSGIRSKDAVDILLDRGYRHIYHLECGLDSI